MSNKIHKTKVKELLMHRNFDDVLQWAENLRNPQRVLLSLVYDADELVKRRAIEAVGKVTAFQARSNIEKVRDLIRQQLWLMNDESGGLGWHAPETIGEILVNVPALIKEYGELLLSFLQEEPFESGSHLAVFRVASVDPKPFIKRVSELSASIDNPDPQIRIYAALAINKIDNELYEIVAKKLINIKSEIIMYDFKTGLLVNTSIGRVIRELLQSDNSSPRAA